MPRVDAEERLSAIQVAITGNSVTYKERDVTSTIRELEELMNENNRIRRRQVTPEMMQAMGIPVEIEYLPSA